MNLKKVLILQILIIVLLISSIGYIYSQTTIFTISQGIYPSSATFTVWKSGSSYYSKNRYGVIVFSGTNATTVIQSSLDSSSRGDTVFLQGRIFELGSSFIQLKNDGIRLIGVSGWTLPQTELKVTGADYAIKVRKPDGSSLYGYEISHLYIDGTNVGYGIELFNCHWGSVHHVYLINCVIGIKVMGAWESEIYSNQIRSSSNRGIWVDGQLSPVAGAHHVLIKYNYIDGTPYGIIIDDDANNPINIIIEANDFGLANNTDGIFVNYKTRGLKIIFNYFETASNLNGTTGIVLNGVVAKPMMMTTIFGNTFITPNRAIYIDYATNTTINDNYMFGYGASWEFLYTTGNEINVTRGMNTIES